MKISDLLKKLEEIRSVHGDLDVDLNVSEFHVDRKTISALNVYYERWDAELDRVKSCPGYLVIEY